MENELFLSIIYKGCNILLRLELAWVSPGSIGNADIVRLDTFTRIRTRNITVVCVSFRWICHFVYKQFFFKFFFRLNRCIFVWNFRFYTKYWNWFFRVFALRLLIVCCFQIVVMILSGMILMTRCQIWTGSGKGGVTSSIRYFWQSIIYNSFSLF